MELYRWCATASVNSRRVTNLLIQADETI